MIAELTFRPPAWTEKARCRILEPAEADRIFFPNHGQVTREAAELCLSCPVRRPCRQRGERETGIWSGVYNSRD